MNRLRRPFQLIRDAYQRDPFYPVGDGVFIAVIAALSVWRLSPVMAVLYTVGFAAWTLTVQACFEAWRQAKDNAANADSKWHEAERAFQNVRRHNAELRDALALERVKVDKLEAALDTSENYRMEREEDLAEAKRELRKARNDRDLAAHRARIYDEALANTPTTGADIRRMCEAFGQDVHDELYKPDGDVRALRIALLVEEVKEYLAAEQADNIVEIADGLADVVVIAYGTACAYGIDLDAVLAEVYRSNMSKVVDGEVIYNEMGKVQKPDTYSPPAVADVIGHMDGDAWSTEVAA